MKICTVETCTNKHTAKGFCKFHYLQNKPACQVADCDNKSFGRGYCRKHHARLMRHGDVTTVLPAGKKRAEQPTYEAVHLRLNRLDNGPANQYRCVDCGNQAQQWSYNHDDPDELVGGLSKRPNAKYVYSAKPECYSPRCRRCHCTFDKAHRAIKAPELVKAA